MPDLSLPGGQDALIAAVAAANPHTIVVLETGGPVLMPWLDKVSAVLEAWVSRHQGRRSHWPTYCMATSIRRAVCPITFPARWNRRPIPCWTGCMTIPGKARANYDIESSHVGYRWYDAKGLTPLFAFGHGLSYTSFKYDDLQLRSEGNTLHASFKVTNIGTRAGRDTPQLYVTARRNSRAQRLVGWGNVDLAPGESTKVSIDVDPRLLADWSTPEAALGAGGGPL